jgi:hypothetical protein
MDRIKDIELSSRENKHAGYIQWKVEGFEGEIDVSDLGQSKLEISVTGTRALPNQEHSLEELKKVYEFYSFIIEEVKKIGKLDENNHSHGDENHNHLLTYIVG